MSDAPVATLSWPARLGRLLALVLLAGVALQLYFVLRIALMTVLDPASTTFQRSEIWRLATERGRIEWAQEWRDYAALGTPIARAVIASEDAGFVEHSGVEWDALEKAWERNQRAEAVAERRNEQLERRQQQALARGRAPAAVPARVEARVVGGSTITQQLAKNLFLSGERTAARKAQEFAITFMLEALLSKRRILEIYLNHVEWGEGLFGAQAAARHYFHTDADRLGSAQAARLAVMLPAPKRFEQRPGSGYLVGRAGTIAARMGAVQPPR
ncbi:transglycosylase domain-containing protein [Sphaerotilus uruguayifluvii]|uniref:Biosynthetic peptidoglycan transglycosylase n=1 Tax=Sphaerotilus uruguayifluvii TaxID=2735897 RepID=A0ABX2G217_9BURK|nr:transglycosylase domain-containing protein [Leptothrix sp. C29]NRT56343.1 monofunctional biosynthetic peptidoglycan transglycosylase [Leptothrix sp. C29]